MPQPSMQRDFHQIDFKSVDIKPSDIEKVEILRKRETHLVCRVKCLQESYILKWFYSPRDNKEPHVYTLLEKYEVDILPVYRRTECALLLEDLQYSEAWRLPDQYHMKEAETGTADRKMVS